MLTELYIEALVVDEELAHLVGELSEAGMISDQVAAHAWRMLPKTLFTPAIAKENLGSD